MAFKHFAKQTRGVELLQRSLARGRLGHAYLFAGDQLEELETLARTLAKTLNCQNPVQTGGVATDCCDACLSCREIDRDTHADVHWARPESKSRIITVEQTRELMREIQLKPTGAEYKVAIIAGADRLNVQAANAFLKTLEEPPGKSVLILLTTEPQRILETILSRCLRLNFFGEGVRPPDPAQMEWLSRFDALAADDQKSLLGRYRLLTCCCKNSVKSGSAWTKPSPRARRCNTTMKLKRICAKSGRTNSPRPSRRSIAASGRRRCCSCNGGCATCGCAPSPPAGYAEIP